MFCDASLRVLKEPSWVWIQTPRCSEKYWTGAMLQVSTAFWDLDMFSATAWTSVPNWLTVNNACYLSLQEIWNNMGIETRKVVGCGLSPRSAKCSNEKWCKSESHRAPVKKCSFSVWPKRARSDHIDDACTMVMPWLCRHCTHDPVHRNCVIQLQKKIGNYPTRSAFQSSAFQAMAKWTDATQSVQKWSPVGDL